MCNFINAQQFNFNLLIFIKTKKKRTINKDLIMEMVQLLPSYINELQKQNAKKRSEL